MAGTDTTVSVDGVNDTSLADLQKQILQAQLNQINNPVTNKSAFTEDPSFNNLLGDSNAMGNITGLASTLMQAAALPATLENAKLQNKALKFNLDTAKQEQARRNNSVSAFNAFRG